MNIWSLLGASKSYTKESVDGLGSIKGAPCTVKSITKNKNISTVTFEWTSNSGVKQTSDMTVLDAANITSISIDENNNHIIFTLEDGKTIDGGEMPMEKVKVSAESGNALVEKADGLYASSTGVQISADTDNAIETKPDGLYVPKAEEVDIVTSFGTTPSDDKVPSEKLVKDSLDTKLGTDKINQIAGETEPTVPSLEFMKANTYSLGLPEENLEEGQDLDELTTRNRKYKTTGAVAATLLHCPVTTTGFRLTVYSLSVTSYVTQLLETSDEKYIRYWNKSKNKWYDWKKFASDDDLANYVAIQQKAEDKGKALVVGEDGKLILGEVATSDIGSVELNMLGWNVPSELSLKNEVVGNKFIQKVGRVDLGSLDWGLSDENRYIFRNSLIEIDNIKPYEDIYTIPNAYIYGYIPFGYGPLSADDDLHFAISNTADHRLVVIDHKYNSVSSFKSAMKGKYLYYELATPIEKVIDGNEILANKPNVDKIYADGYASRNLLRDDVNERQYVGVTIRQNGDGGIKLTGTPTGGIWFFENETLDLTLKAGTYTLTHGFDLFDGTSYYHDTFTLNSNKVMKNLHLGADVGTAIDTVVYIQLEVGDKATPWTRYFKSTAQSIEDLAISIAEIKLLGWNPPLGFPIKNKISGKTFYQKVNRMSLKNREWTADGIGVGGIYVYRTPIPVGLKTYGNNVKWNIYVDGYITRPLVTDRVNDVASNDLSVGGRSAGGNFIEFSTTWYTTPEDFKQYMDDNEMYLYYEMSYPGYINQMAGKEITARHREVIKLGTIQSMGTTSSSLYVDDDIMEYYDEVKFVFQTYPIGGGSSYKMVIGKDSISKEDVDLFPITDLYVPFGGAFANYYGQIDPPSYDEEDNQTIFKAGVSGKPSNFSDVLVHIFAIKYW